nr:hypothetical protein KitaXyl93_20920 [Kitasatospora sp. Xyl93]
MSDDAEMDAFIDQLDAVGAAVAEYRSATTDQGRDEANAHIDAATENLRKG